jgi:diadenosine tetraphosphate (Ap4A) HIT family hydrolase
VATPPSGHIGNPILRPSSEYVPFSPDTGIIVSVVACPFCQPSEEEVLLRHGRVYAMWTQEPPLGSAMVVPVAHRATPFDLSNDEWSATVELLHRVREIVAEQHRPDGWNVGWNVGEVGGQSIPHAHLHVVPRYADEPFAGRGLRWWIKSSENARP